MSTPILATKLFIPPPRPTGVLRPRLVERLNAGLNHKLTLISAPAGFGKSTLVSEWVAGEPFGPREGLERQVAWLSLDEEDSDPTRFLTYLIAALRTVAPQLGEGVLALLQSPQLPPIASILALLLNEITTISHKFVLVLDDYHVIDAKAVDDALAFLVEHLPPQMHLLIATRQDPQLPLARLRARNQLTELRSTDLRFTTSEAAGFLHAMNLELSAEDVAALKSRTEGWIAGLQLAALSMQGHEDVTGFIRAFAGDHRYIVDYLVEEVLQRQPQAVRNFLLQTAILDRLTGGLCDAVTGQVGGNERLEALERGNFFVVPLDDKRHWYRYHHLFAEVLYVHLLAEQPDQLATLHRRASEWYEQHGPPANAIRHALVAEDFDRAARLIERALPELRRNREGITLLGWLKAIPDEVLHFRPVLNVAYGWALMAGGELDAVEARLRDAECWLDTAPELSPEQSRSMAVVDPEEFQALPASIAVYRAAHAQVTGNVAGAIQYARQALDLAAEEDHLRRGAASSILGLASWWNGDLESAYHSYAEGMARLQMAGNISDVVTGAISRADIRIAQGRLHEAVRIYEQALQRATEKRGTEHGEPLLHGTADLYVGMSELLREHNDLDAATQHLLKSQELGERIGIPANRYRWCFAMARIREAQGDADGALDLLDEAERLYVRDFSPNVSPVAALKARVWVTQGRLSEALAWAREQGLSDEDDLSYEREFEHITLARVLLARSKSDPAGRSLLEAMTLLDRLLKAAQAGERKGSAIEILLLQALAHYELSNAHNNVHNEAHGAIPAALMSLQQALTLAESEGYFRIFVDEGSPMAQLLRAAAERGIMPAYTAKLLTAFGEEQAASADEFPRPTSPTQQPLIEPLSEREREVLRLFATELSGPEIAGELVIALSTVRTHTKGIYSKLNVNSRREAIKRAEELDLI